MPFNGACGSVLLISHLQMPFISHADGFTLSWKMKYAGSMYIRETL